MPIKIIIVEDEAIIAAEIRSTLSILGYDVVGHAMNGDKALDLFANQKADLILLDINIKGTISGIDLAKIIRKKYNIPFVFLTSFSDKTTLDMVKTTIPYGYILKPFNDNDLKVNIELALNQFDAENERASFSKANIEERLNIKLTNREYEILDAFRLGKTYKETADNLFLSVNTIKTYQKRLFQLLEINSKHELVSKINDY